MMHGRKNMNLMVHVLTISVYWLGDTRVASIADLRLAIMLIYNF